MKNLLRAIKDYGTSAPEVAGDEAAEHSSGIVSVSLDDLANPLPLKSFVTYKLVRLQEVLDAQLSRILEQSCQLNLDQWRVTNILGHYGAMTQSELHHRVGFDHFHLADVLDTLETQALVEGEMHPSDIFHNRWQLTQTGEEMFAWMKPIIQARQRMLMDGFSMNERRIFYNMIDKLMSKAEQDLPD